MATPPGGGYHQHPIIPEPRSPVEHIAQQPFGYDYLCPAVSHFSDDERIDRTMEASLRYSQYLENNPISQSPHHDRVIKRYIPAVIKAYNNEIFEMTSTPIALLEPDCLMICFGDMEGEWRTTKWKVKRGDWIYWWWVNSDTRYRTIVRVKSHHVFVLPISARVQKALKKVTTSIRTIRRSIRWASVYM
jgi:hypothetical protein